MTDVTFAVVDVSPQPYAVTPMLTARVGVAAVGDDPVHAIALALPGSDRPAAAPLLRRGSGRAARPVRTSGAWAHTQRDVRVAALRGDGAGLLRRHPGRAAAGVHVRLRGHRRQVPARIARRHDPTAVPVQRNGFHPGRARLRCPAGAVGPRGPLRPAGVGLAEPDGPALSEHRLGAAEPRHARRAGGVQVRARHARVRRRGHVTAGRGDSEDVIR